MLRIKTCLYVSIKISNDSGLIISVVSISRMKKVEVWFVSKSTHGVVNGRRERYSLAT